MLADLLHALNIFSESGINDVGVKLRVGTVLDTSLSVKEPLGDGVIGGLGEDIADLVDLFLGEVTGSSVHVNLSNSACEDSKTSTDTLDDTECEADLMLSVDVGVHHTEEVLELVGVGQNKVVR